MSSDDGVQAPALRMSEIGKETSHSLSKDVSTTSQFKEQAASVKTQGRLPISGNPSIRKFFPEEGFKTPEELPTVMGTYGGVGKESKIKAQIEPDPPIHAANENERHIPETSLLEEKSMDGTERLPQETARRSTSGREEVYKIVGQVGEGTFGKVYKAQNLISRAFVALKRLRMEGERDGFPVTAMREIKLLQYLQHLNVVRLHEMMVSKGIIYLSSVRAVSLTTYLSQATSIWSSNTWIMI